MDGTEPMPVCMAEQQWEKTMLSIAKYYGETRYNGMLYTMMRKDGKDFFEAATEAAENGRENPIEPGEPRDLVREDFVPFYRQFGREKFFALLLANKGITDDELRAKFRRMAITCKTCKHRRKVKMNEYAERMVNICVKKPAFKGCKAYQYIHAGDLACNWYEKDEMIW